ncbi:Predicted dehydrogenase [Halogranum amylolyticum]|uniref:Predicted dehydrogenase n=1 Tax=Halogranum amylolyticum TaxID=660520 RepID=A0A1H8UI95_9EURY|nr:Gfo/Idh/MocA family oxidoreductase [Halogranum amylolyticum]SEP02757.1 Predicted dehydrogenase [Halogranum amylolyticum]
MTIDTGRPVRIGVLSTAHVHTDEFAGLLSQREDVEFVGLTDDDEQRGRKAADKYGVPFMSRDELLSRCDGALVFSTNTTHGKWVRAAAAAGVHVLCEKPLATNLEEARDLAVTCETAGINLAMLMPLPFSEPACRAKRVYEDGAIGDLAMAIGTNRARLRNRHETGWSADVEHAGGGAVMDHTVHIVGLVRWLTGCEVVSVHAELATMQDGPETETINVLSMELDDGTPFTLDGSWDRPEQWHYWGDATLELIGDEGDLYLDCFDYTFHETRDTGDNQGISSIYWGEEPNIALLDDFLLSIREEQEPKISGRDGLYEAAVCLAAYESAAAGGPVAVEYPPIAEEG